MKKNNSASAWNVVSNLVEALVRYRNTFFLKQH